MGSIVLGAITLTIAVLALVFKRLPRARNWLFLIAGVCFIGGMANYGVDIANGLINLIAPATEQHLGVGAAVLGTILGAALMFLLIHSLMPKKGKAEPWHGPLFFFAPAILLSLGGVFAEVVSGLGTAVNSLAATIGI